MADDGWIKLHRKLLENPIFQNPYLLQIFIYCLLRANHKNRELIWNGKMETIQTGSFITGRLQMAKDLKQRESALYKRLQLLTKLGYIELKSNNRFTLLTIVKYKTYQLAISKEEQQSNNKVTTKEQQSNTNNNDNNVKNDKNKSIGDFPNLNNETFIKAFNEWIEFRKEIRKTLKPATITKQLEFLNKQPDPIACINNSIMKGYQGLFEVKNGTNTPNGRNSGGLPPAMDKKYKTAEL